MTKEQLESLFEECYDNNTKATGGGYEADFTDKWGLWKQFEPHIAEFVQQQSLEFYIWAQKTGWIKYEDMDRWRIIPINYLQKVESPKTFNELYTLFLSTINIK